jgi:AcrR family transcriptional regulator
VADETPGTGDSLPPQLARLPPGRHGLPRDFVAHNHRDRLIAACSQQVQERGYGATTVADIIRAAAVSRRTFYEHFESKEACFIGTYDLLMGYLRSRVFAAFEEKSAWPEQVRAGLAALLRFLAERPDLARLCMVEPLAAGPPVSDHHREKVAGFTPLFAPGRAGEKGAENGPAEGTEEAVLAGIASLVTRRIVAGQAKQLPGLLPDLVETALTPFLGVDEAVRFARQQAP